MWSSFRARKRGSAIREVRLSDITAVDWREASFGAKLTLHVGSRSVAIDAGLPLGMAACMAIRDHLDATQ